MKPAPFDMVRPDTIDEVLDVLSRHEDVKVLAGGQSLVPLMNLRMVTPSVLVDLNRVQGLSGIEVNADHLRIGAMFRQKDLLADPLVSAHAPLLARATAHVGHVQTRSRGTLGGSLAHADPSAELPLAIVALDAVLVAASPRGTRPIPGSSFFVDVLTTDLAPDEIVTEIRIPLGSQSGTRVAFHEFAARHGDFAIAAAAVKLVRQQDDVAVKAVLGGVAPVPIFCENLSRHIGGTEFDPNTLQALIAEEVRLLDPPSDLQASSDHRRKLAELALSECLQQVFVP